MCDMPDLMIGVCAQYNPSFSSYSLGYVQNETTTVLTVVRPVSHGLWPINTAGPTWMVYASGFDNVFGYHSDNHAVSSRVPCSLWCLEPVYNAIKTHNLHCLRFSLSRTACQHRLQRPHRGLSKRVPHCVLCAQQHPNSHPVAHGFGYCPCVCDLKQLSVTQCIHLAWCRAIANCLHNCDFKYLTVNELIHVDGC